MSNKKFYAMIFELLVNSSIFLYVEITGMRGTTKSEGQPCMFKHFSIIAIVNKI
jgi:hypothetical protein